MLKIVKLFMVVIIKKLKNIFKLCIAFKLICGNI